MCCKTKVSFFFVLSLFTSLQFSSSFAFSETNKSKAIKELEDSLFPSQSLTACLASHPKSLSEGYPNLGPDFNKLLETTKNSIHNGKSSDLVTLFHARLKIQRAQIEQILRQMRTKLKDPLEVSTLHVFALHDPQEKAPLLNCDVEGMSIYPLFGYRLQFAVWLQILGTAELGRVFIQIVPDRAQEWKIGSFYYAQWTHNSKTAQDWQNEAIAHTKKQGLLAYLEFDIAAKLLRTSPHFKLDAESTVITSQEHFLSKANWEAQVRKLLAPCVIRHLSSIFVEEGVGLSIRIESSKELSGSVMQTECKKVWQSIGTAPEFSGLKGIRCGFVLPEENADNDGISGSIFLRR